MKILLLFIAFLLFYLLEGEHAIVGVYSIVLK
jgi:hypothetical protein